MSSDHQALVVEGDNSLGVEIGYRLFSIGHRFAVAGTQVEAYQKLKNERPDFLVLNHCLSIFPGLPPTPETGLNLLKYIRGKMGVLAHALPVIVMSRCRKDMESGLHFMKVGANECIPIPIEEARESFETKIERALRNRNFESVEEYKHRDISIPSIRLSSFPPKKSLSQCLLEINLAQQSVYCRGKMIKLRQMQFKLLLLLARTPNIVVQRTEIFNTLFGPPGSNEDERPEDGQIDKVKSLLIKAFTPVLGKRAKELIIAKSKVGLLLNVPAKNIKIIEESQIDLQHIPTEQKTEQENVSILYPPLSSMKHSPCSGTPFCTHSGCI